MEAKRRLLDETATPQCAADDKRKAEAEGGSRAAVASESVVVQ
jgi:hypothetical protein